MKSITRTAAVLVLVALATEATGAASVGSRSAAYIGGTVTTFSNATAPIRGQLRTTDETALVFEADVQTADVQTHDGVITIPYTHVLDVEYGQKAGRRVGAAIGYSVVFGPAGLLALLSKKRHHYVTVEYAS